MRGVLGPSVLVVLIGTVFACGDASTSKISPKVGSAAGEEDDSTSTRNGRTDGGLLDEEDGGGIGGGNGGSPDDEDNDGVANADDCDPKSNKLGRRIVEDALATEKGLFAPAAGFPSANWTFEGAAAYRQMRLVDGADVAFYAKDSAIGDVQVEIATASTEVSSAFTPKLRQIFVLVGGVSNTGTLNAVGCGIEVVGGESPEQKSSIVKLSGTTTNMQTTVLQRVSRPAVQANEDLAVKVRFEDGAMICDVTQIGITTTATANGLGALTGSVGVFTRQTKALFRNIRVCALK